ncbi:unnamed protein product, partial [Polarella glacialis]
VYDDEFLEALEANGPEIVPEMLTRSKSGISASLHTPLGATKLGNFADDESPSENEEIPRFGDPRDHSRFGDPRDHSRSPGLDLADVSLGVKYNNVIQDSPEKGKPSIRSSLPKGSMAL